MEYLKILYVRFDDKEQMTETIKDIMKDDDMEIDHVDGNEYVFDSNGDYTRTLIIKEALNGWIMVADEDIDHTEELGIMLSAELSCFVLCMSINKGVLSYEFYGQGEQKDQYMSSLKNYEYEVDDEVREMYSGNAKVFDGVTEEENIDKLQQIIDDCRDGMTEPGEAALQIQKLFGMIEYYPGEEEAEKDDEDDEENEDEDEDLMSKMFYVDFKSINIKAESNQDIITAVSDICGSMGYDEVNEFSSGEEQKKGFFRKILNSVKEEERVQFYISPAVNGWVTLVGELEKCHGGEPTEWEFLHIEDKLSEMLKAKTILLHADSEAWGFNIFEDGNEVYKYSSTDESIFIEDINGVLPDMDEEQIKSIFDRELLTAKDIDTVYAEFCDILGIRNFRINIPMDYSDEEFLKNIISRLPDGGQFINFKYMESK